MENKDEEKNLNKEEKEYIKEEVEDLEFLLRYNLKTSHQSIILKLSSFIIDLVDHLKSQRDEWIINHNNLLYFFALSILLLGLVFDYLVVDKNSSCAVKDADSINVFFWVSIILSFVVIYVILPLIKDRYYKKNRSQSFYRELEKRKLKAVISFLNRHFDIKNNFNFDD